MVKIVSDTSTLYSIESGKQQDIEIVPLQISVNQQTYKEFEDLTSTQLLEMIKEGHIPTSSQPPLGSVLEVFEQYQNNHILNISMADGLSGTYQTACMAKNQSEGDITVINSKTLCGPHRYLVDKANQLAHEGKTVEEIVEILQPSIDSSISFLIPQDFGYLKRGGRCSKVAAELGGLLKLIIVMKQSKDGTALEKHSLARTYKKALMSIRDAFKEHGVNHDYIISISHATNEQQVQDTRDFLKKEFPETQIDIYDLSCAFITQGGPGCLAIQAILK